ncbi:MAG: dual specificity protein phosphatase family protein [Candidatus Lokiarchaeota archaeon]|nr:dual specificity protein phosphatase family protein [Candidatus Lokiarchaeota archaeon]
MARARAGDVLVVRTMDGIVDGIFLGDEDDAKNRARLDEVGIRAVINCTTRVDNPFEGQGLAYLRLGLEESSHVTPEVAARVREFVQEHRPRHGILVHCAEGVQRSPAIVILILIQDGLALFDAFELVEKRCRWQILPTFEMLSSIARLDLNGEHVDEAAIKQYYLERFRLRF